MALENLRVTESVPVDEDDPRFAPIEPYESQLDLELSRGQWYDRNTREPVTFSSSAEAHNWFRNNVKVGDYVETSDWERSGEITDITPEFIRFQNRRNRLSWTLE